MINATVLLAKLSEKERQAIRERADELYAEVTRATRLLKSTTARRNALTLPRLAGLPEGRSRSSSSAIDPTPQIPALPPIRKVSCPPRPLNSQYRLIR